MQGSNPPPEIALTSRVEFHPLHIHQETGRDPLVGSTEMGRYMEVEPIALDAIRAIESSANLDEAEEKLAASDGERPDLVGLVQAMYRVGLVHRIDGVEIPPLESMTRRHNFLRRLSPAKARFIRHPAVLAFCAISIFLAILIFIVEPQSIPSYRDLRLFERPSLAMASIMGGTLVMAYLHELAHFFTARSYGIEARINVSNRFYMVVLQTDVTQAHTLGNWQKTAIFCAGIVFNLTMMGLGALVSFAIQVGWLEVSAFQEAAVRYFMAINLLPLLFQLFIFARTDLYHLLAAWTGHRNLLQDSRRYLSLQGQRLLAWFLVGPRIPCASCNRSLFDFDPYCPRCGSRQRVQDPNKYPFQRRDRWMFALFGTIATVGPIFFFLFMGRYILRLFYELTYVSATLGHGAVQEGNLLAGAESGGVLFLLGMQAFFLAKFVFTTLASALRAASLGFRFYYGRHHLLLHPLARPLIEAALTLSLRWPAAVRSFWNLQVQPRLPLRFQALAPSLQTFALPPSTGTR